VKIETYVMLGVVNGGPNTPLLKVEEFKRHSNKNQCK
jgi:hypothetical protein